MKTTVTVGREWWQSFDCHRWLSVDSDDQLQPLLSMENGGLVGGRHAGGDDATAIVAQTTATTIVRDIGRQSGSDTGDGSDDAAATGRRREPDASTAAVAVEGRW